MEAIRELPVLSCLYAWLPKERKKVFGTIPINSFQGDYACCFPVTVLNAYNWYEIQSQRKLSLTSVQSKRQPFRNGKTTLCAISRLFRSAFQNVLWKLAFTFRVLCVSFMTGSRNACRQRESEPGKQQTGRPALSFLDKP